MQDPDCLENDGDTPLTAAKTAESGERREGALKKPEQKAKPDKTSKEERLAAALRENLRRRKAAQKKAKD